MAELLYPPTLGFTEDDAGKIPAVNEDGDGWELIDAPEAPKQGVAVADPAGEAPTAAEFKALLDSLRGAGIIKT